MYVGVGGSYVHVCWCRWCMCGGVSGVICACVVV